MYDLHIHTSASDGVFSAEEVIDQAIEIGLSGIAITDHDTVASLATAENYIKKLNNKLDFVPGIEINTDYKGDEVHILGYYIDYNNEVLLNKLNEFREARYQRAIKMLAKLKKMGFDIELATVQKFAAGGLIARPHIGQALVEKGYVFSIKEAFEKYLSKGKPAYVARVKFSPVEAIQLIKMAGGIAVLAHPGLIKNSGIIDEVVEMGIEGLEVYYPEHNELQIKNFINICLREKLLITGGSDFHGFENDAGRSRLGYTGITREHFTHLVEYYLKRNKN